MSRLERLQLAFVLVVFTLVAIASGVHHLRPGPVAPGACVTSGAYTYTVELRQGCLENRSIIEACATEAIMAYLAGPVDAPAPKRVDCKVAR